jgi:hypothetical protein
MISGHIVAVPWLLRMTRSAARSAGRRSRRRSSAAIGRGRTAALLTARRACGDGTRTTPSTWPPTTAAGSRRTRKRSEPRTDATGSGSARTPTIESEGERAPAAATGSGEPKTPTIWSGGEPTTAATGSESEPDSRRRRPTQTTAEATARPGRRSGRGTPPAKPSASLPGGEPAELERLLERHRGRILRLVAGASGSVVLGARRRAPRTGRRARQRPGSATARGASLVRDRSRRARTVGPGPLSAGPPQFLWPGTTLTTAC